MYLWHPTGYVPPDVPWSRSLRYRRCDQSAVVRPCCAPKVEPVRNNPPSTKKDEEMSHILSQITELVPFGLVAAGMIYVMKLQWNLAREEDAYASCRKGSRSCKFHR